MNKFLKYSVILVLLLLSGNTTLAQRALHILKYDLSSYPDVNIDYFVFDENGYPDFTNKLNDFEVLDNGKNVPVTYQNCLSINPSDDATVLISVDLSIKNDTIDNKVDKTLDFLNQIINNLNLYNVTAGLHSFNAMAYLNHDFTTNQNSLSNYLSTLLFSSGSIIDTGFFSQPLGSIELIKNRQGNKSIIYFSSTYSRFDADKIISEAKANSIKIFPVYFGREIPPDLLRVADETGGFAMLIADTVNQFRTYALSLLAFTRNFRSCNLAWRNDLDCYDIHVETIKLPALNIEDEFAFEALPEFKPGIISNPSYLRFSSVRIGTSKSLNVLFRAKNGDLTISDLILHNPKFSIDSGDITAPVILPKDSSRTVKITFTPTDSAIVFDSLEIISNACSGTSVLITGGYPNTPPSERTLTLISPNCGDNLIVGDTTFVSWKGFLPADVIQLQYSTDNGANWDTLATDITGLDYNWTVPDIESDSCLVRVIQLWPNNIGRTMVLPHDGGVNCANFNRDGSLVITASKDTRSLVRIWNANNGQLIHELTGHNKAINWVNFDVNDKYALSASDDSTIIIWDVSEGTIIRKLTGHKNIVRAANFSPSGKFIVSASPDGFGYIWDVETGKIIDSIFSPYPLWFAEFSPDEKYIVFTNGNGQAIVYEFPGKKLYNTFDLGIGVVPYAAFNQQMTKIAAAGWFGKAVVWDFISGDELYRVTHDTTDIVPINSCTFDNSDIYLLTAGADTVPRLWDSNTGEQITTLLNEHTSSVQIATFNFDAKRILTASWDSTAKVWNRDQIGLQIDTTDCVFKIKKLKVEVNDVIFADTPLGTITDTLVIPFIKNLLDFPIEVKSYRITGTNADDFEIINNLPPHYIDSAGSNYIELRFNPGALGPREAFLEILLPGNVKRIRLAGNGTKGTLQFVSNVVDFGLVFIGDTKDTSISIINNSGSAVRIDSIKKLGPDYFHFNVTSQVNGKIIQPGERLDVSLRFMPETIGRLNSLVRFYHNGSSSVLDLSMFGEGVLPRIDTATIVIGDASGKPGDIIQVPVYISSVSSQGIAPTITGFNITVEFNSTLLEPLNDSNPEIYDGKRKLKLELPVTFDNDSLLKLIEFRVGLGNDTVTSINITELSLSGNGKMVLFGKDGQFTLQGYCVNGGNRLFESDSRLFLSNNVPNPVYESTEITFSVIEKGRTELYLIDILGNRISTIVSGELQPGVYSYKINSSGLPAGKIFYILQTPTQVLVKSMDILK